MHLLDLVRDAPLYRTVFQTADQLRTYAVACYQSESDAAAQWFKTHIGPNPKLVPLDAAPDKTAGGITPKSMRARPELAVVVFGQSGRKKAVQLTRLGIRYFAFAQDQGFTRHKFDPHVFETYQSRFERIFDRLADDESKLVFASLLKFRITGDHGYLRISDYAQYRHPEVRAMAGEWVGDCGALTGATALGFAKSVGPTGAVYAFEPDPFNYRTLAARTDTPEPSRAPITALNYGLSDSCSQAPFLAGRAGASRFDATGDITVPLRTLDMFDQAHQVEGPGMLSFDVEGFEYQALTGGQELIKRLRPKLQISLYHKRADLFRLPLWVMENYPDSDLYIGHHSPHSSESVLYVLPRQQDHAARPLPRRVARATGVPDIWPRPNYRDGHFDPFTAERRFGCGLSPVLAPPESIDQMISDLHSPDPVEDIFPIETFPQFLVRMKTRRAHGLARIRNTGKKGEATARHKIRETATMARQDQIAWMRNHFLRRAGTGRGFRERLCHFWGDHFTAIGKTGVGVRGMSTHIETAIRPHIAGRFGDLLVASVTNPLMLLYLDQINSVGAHSAAAKAAPDKVIGMNENLAREVLELHSLGVEAPYTQTDVTELAKAFTGLSYSILSGFRFSKDAAEPGPKHILGVSYGGSDAGSFEDVHAILHMLALRPETARHLSRKLVVHFIGEDPDPALIDVMTHRYLETGGYLPELYRAMLTHPAAWRIERKKVKAPIDFVSSALRAIAMDPDVTQGMSIRDVQKSLMLPMAMMGQPWEEPLGPDGWPEANDAWLTPHGLAARLQWAMAMPVSFQPDLPQPADAAIHALGPTPSAEVRSSVASASSPWEACGLVFGSPEFQTV